MFPLLLAESIRTTILKVGHDYVVFGALGACAFFGVYWSILLVRKIKQKQLTGALATKFLAEVKERIDQGDFEGLAAMCDAPPYWTKAVAQLILIALANQNRGAAKLRALLAEKFEREVLSELEFGHAWVGTMIKSGPMLGLLGTVTGMILSFTQLATASAGGADPKALADGIGLALEATMYGLLIAIPLTILAANVQVRISRLSDSVQDQVNEFMYYMEPHLKK